MSGHVEPSKSMGTQIMRLPVDRNYDPQITKVVWATWICASIPSVPAAIGSNEIAPDRSWQPSEKPRLWIIMEEFGKALVCDYHGYGMPCSQKDVNHV